MTRSILPLALVCCGLACTGTSREDTRGTLSGRVVLDTLAGLDDPTRLVVDIGRGEGSTVPGPDGVFLFSDIEPDTYEIRVTYAGGLASSTTRSGYQPYSTRAVVRAGSSTHVGDIRLQRARGSVVGTVLPPGDVVVEGTVALNLEDRSERRVRLVGNGYRFDDVPVGMHTVTLLEAALPLPGSALSCAAPVQVNEEGGEGTTTPWALERADVSLLPGAADLADQEGLRWFLAGDRVTVRAVTAFAQRARAWLGDAAVPAWAPMPSDGWVFTALPGGRTMLHVQFADACAFTSPVYDVVLERDTQAPVLLGVELGGGATYAPGSTTSLVVNGVDDLSEQLEMRVALCSVDDAGIRTCTPTLEQAAWVPYTPASTITLPTGEGQRAVQVQLRDRAHNPSSTEEDTILVDGTPPVVTGVRVAGGAGTVTERIVEIEIDSVDAAEMQVGTVTDLAGVAWQAFAPSFPYALSPGDGRKDFSVRVRDLAGNAGVAIPLTVTLDTTGDLSGTLAMEDGSSPAGARVSARGTALSAAASADGTWSIPDVPAGAWELEFVAPAAAGTGWSVAQALVLVRAGVTTVVPSVLLQRARGSLRGTVTLEGRLNHAGTLVQVEGTPAAAFTDLNGAYVIAGVATGNYRLAFDHQGFARGQQAGVEVVAGQDVAVPAVELLERRGTLTGSVRVDGRTTHEGVRVDVLGTTHSATSDASGTFSIPGVLPGAYTVQAQLAEHEPARSGVITVVGDTTSEVGVLVLEKRKGLVAGIALANGGPTHAGTSVTLVNTSLQTTTDAAGRYELRVPVGNYSGLTFARARHTTITTSGTITVTSEGTANQETVELQMSANVVQGNATRFRTGSGAGVRVRLLGVPDSPTGGTSYTVDDVGPTGEFQFAEVTLGSYRVEYTYPPLPGWETVLRDVQVVAGPALVLSPVELREYFVQINGDAPRTNNQLVTLSLGASDCRGMCVAETPCPPEGPWVACQATYPQFPLAGGDGEKTVYVRFKDSLDRISEPASDSIILDRTVGISSVTQDTAGQPRRRAQTIHFTLVPVGNERGGNASITIENFQSGIRLYDDGTHGDSAPDDGTYEVQFLVAENRDVNAARVIGSFTDLAGNTSMPSDPSSVAEGTVTIAVPPTLLDVVVIPDSALRTADVTVETDEATTAVLEWGTDPFYGNTENDPAASSRHAWSLAGLSLGEEYHYRVTVTDLAGNSTSTTDRTFRVRPAPPVGVRVIPGDSRVDILWTESSQGNVVGYHVHRSATGQAVDAVRLNASPFQDASPRPVLRSVPFLVHFEDTDGTATHRDPGVPPPTNGESYTYFVTAVDEFGGESAFSTAVVATPVLNPGTGTDVCGVSADTLWTSSGSPYRLTCSFIVPQGLSLTIGPSTRVVMEEGLQLIIEGTLAVVGGRASDERAELVPALPTVNWQGLVLKGGAGNPVLITRARMERCSMCLFGSTLPRLALLASGSTFVVADKLFDGLPTEGSIELLDNHVTFAEGGPGQPVIMLRNYSNLRVVRNHFEGSTTGPFSWLQVGGWSRADVIGNVFNNALLATLPQHDLWYVRLLFNHFDNAGDTYGTAADLNCGSWNFGNHDPVVARYNNFMSATSVSSWTYAPTDQDVRGNHFGAGVDEMLAGGDFIDVSSIVDQFDVAIRARADYRGWFASPVPDARIHDGPMAQLVVPAGITATDAVPADPNRPAIPYDWRAQQYYRTDNRSVVLQLRAPGASEVMVTTDPLFAGPSLTVGGWAAMQGSLPIMLPDVQGHHVVLVKFRDAEGRESEPTLLHFILDDGSHCPVDRAWYVDRWREECRP